MVLDYINLKSDLKSLCLVYVALRALALPRLYRRFEINLAKRSEWDKFLSSLTAGAGVHLRNTKSLTLLETEGGLHPLTVLPGQYKEKEYHNEYPTRSEEDMSHVVQDVMQIFSQSKLTTFRCLSTVKNIPPERLGLGKSDSLEHLHVDVDDPALIFADNVLAPPLFRLIKPSLRTLDIQSVGFRDSALKTCVEFMFDERRTRDVERLYLGFRDSRGGVFNELLDQRKITMKYFHNLRELSFSDVDLFNYSAMSEAMPQLAQLTRLTIRYCPGEDVFLQLLGDACIMGGSALKHLQVVFLMPRGGVVDNCLQSLYDSCGQLESLHLAFPEGQKANCTLANIAKIGHALRSLSFIPVDEPEVVESELQLICSLCPNLEQLAILLPGEIMFHGNELENVRSFKILLKCLRYLPKLEMLHLQQGDCERLANESLSEESFIVQSFVNYIFYHLHHLHHLLYVVWGTEWSMDLAPPHEDPENLEPLETPNVSLQHRFVKGTIADALIGGRRMTVGVPISRDRMRKISPHLDILDYDATQHWPARAPGRFNDN